MTPETCITAPHRQSTRPLRVLHVIPSIAARYGGPSSVIGALCEALAVQPGMTVELATTDADGPRGHIDRSAIPAGFPVHVFPRTCSERWKYSRALGSWLRAHARDHDLIHTHGLWSYSTAAAAGAACQAEVPLVIRPAGMLSEYSVNRHGWQKRLYWALVEGRTVTRAAHFHATSTNECEEIHRCVPGSAVSVIPNGVEEGAWLTPRNSAALRARCGTSVGDRPIVLYLSRLHPKKGITDLLLPAWRQLGTDAFLAIVGGPDEHVPEYAHQVRQSIKHLDLEDRVALLGAVDSTDRWSMFDGADVFVLSSHSENFGIVVAEAMARACPVVVTDAVQSCEHVTRAKAGLVVPRDVLALGQAMDQLLGQRVQRTDFAAAGREYATSHFRWNAVAMQVREMYDRCLSQNSVSRTV